LVYVYQKKLLLGAVGLDLAVGLLGNANTLIPIFAKDILDVGPAGAGFLRSAMAVGGLAGAITLTRFTITRSAGKIMLLGVAVFGLATIGFALSTAFYLSAAAVFVIGYFDMINTTIRNTLIQIATPDHMRGRVGAVSSVSANASNDLGGFRAGLVAAWVGAEASVLLGGIAVLVVAAAMPKMFPELSRAERLDRVL
jgi:MFS family permease